MSPLALVAIVILFVGNLVATSMLIQERDLAQTARGVAALANTRYEGLQTRYNRLAMDFTNYHRDATQTCPALR